MGGGQGPSIFRVGKNASAILLEDLTYKGSLNVLRNRYIRFHIFLYSVKVDKKKTKTYHEDKSNTFTRPLLFPRMHLTTQCLPVLNLDFDNFVTIFAE